MIPLTFDEGNDKYYKIDYNRAFHSRVQHLRMQIIGTNENGYIKKQVELPKDWLEL